MQAYSNPKRASDPHALPDVEVFRGYSFACSACDTDVPLFPDYYGLLHPEDEACPECGRIGVRLTSLISRWYYRFCFPGCLPDSDPFGPFDTQEEALADAQQGAEEEEL